MRFQIKTLVDVTNTGARRYDDPYKYKQETNFMTLFQTIGLRSNGLDFKVTNTKESVDKFGSSFKNTQMVWTVEFYVEQQDSLSVEMMIEDFNLVPILTGLDETVSFHKSCFRSKDSKEKNIIFKDLDK